MITKKKALAPEEISPALGALSAKRLYLLMLLLTYGLFALNTLVLSPILISVSSDIMTASTVFPSILSALMHLIHLVLIPTAAWTLIGFAYFKRESASVKRRLVALYFGSLFFCRACDMALSLFLNGALYLNEDIIYPAWYLVLDLIYALALFLVVRFSAKRFCRREDAALSTNAEPTALYPFRGIFKKGNPILRLTLLLGIIFSAVSLLQEGLYTLAYLYDATNPLDAKEILILVGRYVDCLLIGCFFYLLSLLLYRILFQRAIDDEKEEAEESDSQNV